MLYIVATPIGNLDDITLRAIEILRQSDIIICENPKHTQKLLRHFQIQTKKIIQFAEPQEQRRLPEILDLLKNTDAALVTDAGTPGVSDPGFRLVRACREQNIPITVIPGANAAITALVGSGLPTDKFWFTGFLPRSVKQQQDLFRQAESIGSTLIAYESPMRIQKLIQNLASVFPEAQVSLARELTKIHEQFLNGNAADLAGQKLIQKGEYTVVISFK